MPAGSRRRAFCFLDGPACPPGRAAVAGRGRLSRTAFLLVQLEDERGADRTTGTGRAAGPPHVDVVRTGLHVVPAVTDGLEEVRADRVDIVLRFDEHRGTIDPVGRLVVPIHVARAAAAVGRRERHLEKGDRRYAIVRRAARDRAEVRVEATLAQ